MRIFDRYLLREFLGYLLLGLFTFVGIFVIVDVFEKVDNFVDGKAPISLIARFYMNYVPYVLAQILPVSMLLASLLAIGRLVRQHELTAMQMAGQSLLRVFAPLFLFSFLMAGAAFLMEQYVVPNANHERKTILKYQIKKKPRPSSQRQRNVRYIGQDGRIFLITSYDTQAQMMRGVVVQEFDDNLLTRRIDAGTGRWRNEHWILRNVTVRTFIGDSLAAERRNVLHLHVAERPEDFAKEERGPEAMSWSELRTWVQRMRLSGADVTKHVVDLHTKIAFPLTNLITVLIGASLSTRIRRGSLAMSFGLSLIISFIYFCALRAGQSLGHGGALPPLVAAWAANLVFATVGVVLFVRAQQGAVAGGAAAVAMTRRRRRR